MKVRCSRITSLLKTAGFVARPSGDSSESCAHVRVDSVPSLFQQIDVSFAGRGKEAVVAHVAVSTTRLLSIKGLTEIRLLDEVAADKERGWSIITTSEDARSWEESLARIGPDKATEIALEAGDSLLKRTQTAREYSLSIIESLGESDRIIDNLNTLQSVMTSEQVAEARRLATWPGVMQISNAEQVYLLACLALLNKNPTSALSRQNPLNDDKLMCVIQLTVDGILSRAC